MRFFLFSYTDNCGISYTVVFDNSKLFYKNDLHEDLKKQYNVLKGTDKVIYIYPLLVEDITRIDVGIKVADVFNKKPDEIILLGFAENGFAENNYIPDVTNFGMKKIIKDHNVILESDNSFHFILPSKKHSPYFIRTGNLLVNSIEIGFIALLILDRIKNIVIKEVACDTSSILQIPYAINSLKNLFGSQFDVPFRSFGSYQDVTKFQFNSRTLVLISATNSGGLEDEIRKNVKQKDLDIFTILYNNKDLGNRKILMNLNGCFEDFIVNSITKQYGKDENCSYCEEHSFAVLVRGEQFIPHRVVINRVYITTNCIPDWFKIELDKLIGKECIRVFKSENSSDKRREIFFDVSKTLYSIYNFDNDKAYNLILHLPDEASKEIANLLSKKYSDIKILPTFEMKSLDKTLDYKILAVSSCITTGDHFHELSRDLRAFKTTQIKYFTVISRLINVEEEKTLINNITFNRISESTKEYKSLIKCYLENKDDQDVSFVYKPSWYDEKKILQGLEFKPQFVKNRLVELNNSMGLLNNLFFKNPFDGSDLKLRENFSLHTFIPKVIPSQADVYFIMSGVLHTMRNPKNIPCKRQIARILRHEHVNTILNPKNFSRFNDGILQACILRGARTEELDYQSKEDSSNIYKILSHVVETKGEALLEFLFSILTGKLKIQSAHLKQFIGLINQKKYEIEEIDFFVKLIEKKFDINS